MSSSFLPITETELALLLESTSEAVVLYDREFRFVYMNARAERMLEAPRDTFRGKVLWEAFPDRAASFREPLTRAMRDRVPVSFEIVHEPTGRWTEGRCLPLPNAGADPSAPALAVFFQNVTDRHAVIQAREEAEAARKRMEFLAEASAILSSSLNYQDTLESMARIVVPDLCDWCSVQLPGEDGQFLRQVAVSHVDPAKVQWARDLNQRYPTRMDEPQGMAQVVRSGEAVFLPEIPEEALTVGAKDEEHLRIILGLGFRSAIAVPLIARGTILGALLFVTTDESGRRLSTDDLAFAHELARRAATAIDNAHLFEEAVRAEQEVQHLLERERNIAERLQEALQPSLPGTVPGLELDAYYQPALAEANIGGDFFDVFSLEKGCFVLVVADLSGKGLAAAAQVATVRHMLRALLYQRRTTIAEAATRLNDMLAEHDLLEGFATLFVGAYDVNQRTITYTSCGQEPGLILRRADGSIGEMGPTGPVLGGFPGAEFTERVLQLATGDVLALFTDGLTEAGINRKDMVGLPGVVAAFRQATAETLSAGEIKRRMVAAVEAMATPSGISDDVCLLIARVR